MMKENGGEYIVMKEKRSKEKSGKARHDGEVRREMSRKTGGRERGLETANSRRGPDKS